MACKCENKDQYYVTAAASPDDKMVEKMVFRDVNSNPKRIRGKSLEWAIVTKKLHLDSRAIACKLKNTLDYIKKNFNFAKSGPGLGKYKEYDKVVCKEIGKVVSKDQKCADKCTGSDLDKLKKEKKKCASGHYYSCSKCECKESSKSTPVIVSVPGCIDPKAFNYYCKTNDCGDDKNTLPENMVPTQCEYRVEETLKYTYILSHLNNGDPTDSINTWESGPIVITGNSSYDKSGDDSWLSKKYKGRKTYWTKMCSNISDTTINFSTELGLYKNQGDADILPDLVNALLKFSFDYDEGVSFLKKTKVMIVDDSNNNLGIVSLFDGGLTLDNRKFGKDNRLTDIILYRAKQNIGSKVSSNNYNGSANDFRDYFNGPKFTVDNRVIIVDDNFKISVDGMSVEESIIGLGTLLERKDKPIIGLGSLL